ncbi:MAG: aminopeptidase [Longicatena sp.]
MNKEIIQKYAKLAVCKGVNVQKGQILMINTSVEAIDMTRACVEEAYKAGAKQVVVNYIDECVRRSQYLYEDEETLTNIRPFVIDSKLTYFKEGACILHIISEKPGIFKGLDAEKISKYQFAMSNAGKEVQEYTMLNKAQWCIVAVPNVEWAKQVFPDCEDDNAAVELLWEQILHAVHVEEDNDPVKEWDLLGDRFKSRSKILNDYDFKAMRFENSLGTNLEVGLPEHHIWSGGSDTKVGTDVEFNPNMPTEEIFTMPLKTGVNGVVYASKPLLYSGELIEDFYIEFKDGKAVNFDAQEGKEALAQLISFDEGSCYLGEVALVPYDSPISKSNILFLNTLFDENASCHLALGAAYPTCLKGGEDMSEEELAKAGANISLTHVDFMFGTGDMKITGITKDGKEIPVFENGNFVFD